MKKTLVLFIAVASAVAALDAPAKTKNAPERQQFDRAKLALPYTTHTLENGLTLLVHEDHTAPVVAVHLWYNVGARNETSGRTGLAHLFEHVFSDGSEHYPHDFRAAMNDLGATDLNGFTDMDRTLFFEEVPSSALERTLYLEADRMGFLEKQVSKETLDRQRGIVHAEKRQGEGQPYGRVAVQIAETMYPSSHPYHRSTMGSVEDLDAASVDDVRAWYRQYYGPNNCVLSLAGDVTPEHALQLVKKYFSGILPGPPLRRLKEWVPRLDNNIRAVAQDPAPQARVYRVYHAPGWRSSDALLLKIVASVLTGSNSARLDRQLVFEKQLVTNVRARVEVSELASQFTIVASVKAGVNPRVVEAEIDAILNALLRSGPTAEELQRAKMRELAAFVRENHRLGARAGLLAESMTYAGKPDAYLDRLETQANATAADVRAVANRWLAANHLTLIVTPYPQLSSVDVGVDRSKLPPLGPDPTELGFPEPQSATLANGVKVVLLERHATPIVQCALVVNAGYAAEPPDKRGLASLALAVLPKGTTSRDAFGMVDELDALGARLRAWNTLDVSVVALETLAVTLGPALEIYSDAIRRPAFAVEMLEVTRRQRLADIAQDRADPGRTGMSFVRRVLYGESHPYGGALSGFGSEQSLSAITREDVVAWHQSWFQPNNSTLVVSGDVTLHQLLPHLERTFGFWQQTSAPTEKVLSTPNKAERKVYLIDHPGAAQSVIVGAHVSEPGGQPEDMTIAMVVRGLGGMVTSRLNRNLRVDKQWSYNAWATLLPSRGPRTLIVFAPVRADKTKESLLEIVRELRAITGDEPIAGEELASVMRTETLSLPGRFSTLNSIENAMIDMLSYGYPSTYYSRYAENIRTLREDTVAAVAKKYIRPDEMIWIIRGDSNKIAAGLEELGLGQVVRVNLDGQPVD